MRFAFAFLGVVAFSSAALAQDQQLGARTKAMGGSYTAFEDDPVSVWLNPAGIATQPNQGAIAYQTYTTYPLHRDLSGGPGGQVFSAGAETTMVDPAFVPSYLGFVFQVGTGDSPMAIGICYARPYHLNYSFDHVQDPAQTSFTPDTNLEESFNRFRVAFAKDFRLQPGGESGFLTHVAVGAGIDLGYARYNIKTDTDSASDNVTAPGGGVGVLVGVYDDPGSMRINFGVAYQSAIRWHFSNDPRILPAFDMPNQVNAGLTGYLLKGTPLRTTIDFQWVNWKDTVNGPAFPGEPTFRDALNYSFGAEYRIPLPDTTISLYPRVGYRRFNAPWGNKDNLPMTDNFKLLLDTKASGFNIVTFGAGISWSDAQGKIRAVDVGADVGGDAWNIAFGLTYEF